MIESIDVLLTSGPGVAANLILQLSCLALLVLLAAKCIRHNAAARYAVLYSGLLTLLLVSITSVWLQSAGTGLLQLQLNSSLFFPFADSQIPDPQLEIAEVSDLAQIDTGTAIANPAYENTIALGVFKLLNWLSPVPFLTLLLLAWLCGFLVSSMGIFRSLRNIQALVLTARKLNSQERELIESSFADAMAMPKGLRLRISAEVDTPFLAGILSSVILLPEDFLSGMSRTQLRGVMRHELAHHLRRDPIANLVQKVVVAIFWMHPLIHRIDRSLTRTREEICDNYVLAHESAIDYGETLLRLCAPPTIAAQAADFSGMRVGVVGGSWNVEERIAGLINQKREKIMKLNMRSKFLLNAAVVGSALAISACQVVTQADAESEDRQAAQVSRGDESGVVNEYSTKTAGTLSPATMRRISQVQELMKPADGSEPDLEAAKQLLDDLAERRLARMNDFEKSTLYNFYTNYYLAKEDYQGATDTFEKILTVTTLRSDIRLRSLRSLGQLHAALENWPSSIAYYEQWQTAANRADDTVVLRGLSYANYQLENFDEALPHWVQYMELKQAAGEEVTREDYAYLNGLHFTLENWEQALEITTEMIRLFNTQADRDNLRAIQSKLEEAATSPAVDAG